jgi:hypothetical protein
MSKFVLAALAAIAMCALGQPARAADDCPAATVAVTSAKKFVDRKADDKTGDKTTPTKPDEEIVELGDTIELTMTGLSELLIEADCRKAKGLPKRTLVLFLAAQAIKGLTGYLPGPPSEGKMRFDLAHGDTSKAAWALVLANPTTHKRNLDVSVGYEDSYPFAGTTMLFRPLAVIYAVLGAAFMAMLIVSFFCLLWWTDICRDGKPAIPDDITGLPVVSPSAYGPYSLSKVQAGIWFLVILGGYILIVAVTHDISGTINGTALTLMGIGAATMVGSAVIQVNQGQAADAAKQVVAARKLGQQIKDLTASVATKKGTAEEPAISKLLTDTEFAFKRATNQSIGFWNDIVSDANGVNFQRFQMAAWTIVLAFIFFKAITAILAMPDFDNTLLALQGLSAGTYLGLKITEPKVTDVPGQPKATP